jgi:hypothetical protein
MARYGKSSRRVAWASLRLLWRTALVLSVQATLVGGYLWWQSRGTDQFHVELTLPDQFVRAVFGADGVDLLMVRHWKWKMAWDARVRRISDASQVDAFEFYKIEDRPLWTRWFEVRSGRYQVYLSHVIDYGPDAAIEEGYPPVRVAHADPEAAQAILDNPGRLSTSVPVATASGIPPWMLLAATGWPLVVWSGCRLWNLVSVRRSAAAGSRVGVDAVL